MRKVLILLAALCLFPACFARRPALSDSPRPVVLASQEATLALGRILVRGAAVDVVRAVPRGYSMQGHGAYFKKHWADFSVMADKADAVMTVTSAWPGDPLYSFARRANVRISQVDATRPLDGSRAGVPLMDVPGRDILSPFVWNSPGNFARMADIAAADFVKLYPEDADRIQKNLRALKQALFRLRSTFEARLGALDAYEVVALTSDYTYLTDEFGIEVVKYMTKPEYRWGQSDLTSLESVLNGRGVNTVLCAWQPSREIRSVIEGTGAAVVVFDAFKFTEGDGEEAVLGLYETNLDKLLAALSGLAG